MVMMNKAVYACMVLMLGGCATAYARTSVTGHLFVALTDWETGCPITNASVTVTVDKSRNFSWHASPVYERTSASADTNGIVHVVFQYYGALGFDWRVDAPGHYNGIFGSGHGHERFGCVVEKSNYFNIDTNTVQGLAMYNELVQLDNNHDFLGFVAKFEPKSVTYTNNVISRSVCLTPKHNPRPMFAHGGCDYVYVPEKDPVVTVTNGVEITRYRPVDFDLKECLFLPTKANYIRNWDPPAGEVSDFRIERFRVTTNGVETTYGWLDFAPGCGAYITTLPGDGHYPVIYGVETNATFLSRIPYEYSSVSGRLVCISGPLNEGECMVLRTRALTNDVGEVVSCNYSKIYGPMSVLDEMLFESAIFNPTPNDPNLEFDVDNNLTDNGLRCDRP